MHGVIVKLSKEFIAETTGLPMEGLKFSKETSISNATFKKFPKSDEEEKKMEKSGDLYNLSQIKVIWRDVLSRICEYFILDGRSKRLYKFHFVFFNHFRYKDRVSFPFYLKYSLIQSLQAHRKKESHPVLHEGLILLIEIYCKNKAVKPSPFVEKKQKLTGNNPHSKKIKVKSEEGINDIKGTKKGNKREIKKKNVKEVTKSDNFVEDDDKTEMGDLSLNLDGYFGSRGISTCKDYVDGSKDRKT